jgi:hypothetical protein
MKHSQTITILIHCRNLPGLVCGERSHVRLGIQKGNDVIEDVSADVEKVTFNVSMRVEQQPSNGKPNFLGPFAQGTPQERFIYLCWGERVGNNWHGFRRAKIHLKHLEWQAVASSLETGTPIEAFISMTDNKGEPLCASVKKDKIEWKY